MSANSIAVIIGIAFLIFITARGELPVYIAFFVSTGVGQAQGSSSSSGSSGGTSSSSYISDIGTAAEIAAVVA